MARKKNINKVDKRTTDYKDSKLEKGIRINTSYLVEVSEKDLEIVEDFVTRTAVGTPLSSGIKKVAHDNGEIDVLTSFLYIEVSFQTTVLFVSHKNLYHTQLIINSK